MQAVGIAIVLAMVSLHVCFGQTKPEQLTLIVTPPQIGLGFESDPRAYRNRLAFTYGMGCLLSNRVALEAGINLAIFDDETYRGQTFGGGWFSADERAQRYVFSVDLLCIDNQLVKSKIGQGCTCAKYPVKLGRLSHAIFDPQDEKRFQVGDGMFDLDPHT